MREELRFFKRDKRAVVTIIRVRRTTEILPCSRNDSMIVLGRSKQRMVEVLGLTLPVL